MRAQASQPTPPLIVWMSFQPGIPRRVALQQSPPPLPQPHSDYDGPVSSPIALQRMVACPWFPCLRGGVHSSLPFAEILLADGCFCLRMRVAEEAAAGCNTVTMRCLAPPAPQGVLLGSVHVLQGIVEQDHPTSTPDVIVAQRRRCGPIDEIAHRPAAGGNLVDRVGAADC